MNEAWYTDRTRYMRGFECRWKRLLGFHAFGTGITGRWLSAPLATGRHTHRVLEKLLRQLQAGEEHESWMEPTNRALVQVLSDYRDDVDQSRGILGDYTLDSQLDMVTGMSHGYARIVLPFVQRHFKILAVEREVNLVLPGNIIWMARPDFVAEARAGTELHSSSEARSIHDFKSTSYWDEEKGPRQWHNSVQMMANAYATAKDMGVPISQYYMHMMVKGNKKYPNILTHAYYRPGNPPFSTEDWKLKWTREKSYSRVRIADFRNLPDWIWEADGKELATKFPVVGPYTVHDYTVQAFFAGVQAEEGWWRDRTAELAGVDWQEEWPKDSFQRHLDGTFPRTYACHDFSGHKCQFYDLCHKGDEWQDPLGGAKPSYVRRVPHHEQEGKETA